MRERASELTPAGVAIVAIGRREPWQAARLVADGIPFPLLCDPEAEAFGAFGLRTRPGVLLRPRGWARWVGSNLRGSLQGRITGPVTQEPGDAVLDGQGLIRFLYRGRDLSDHAPVERLVREALDVAAH